MATLCADAHEVIVLDHHITALNNLAGLDQELKNLTLHLDMNQSGAMLAWRYFHNVPAPRLIECVQDRDLWQWQLAESYDLNTGLMSYPFDFNQWHVYNTVSPFTGNSRGLVQGQFFNENKELVASTMQEGMIRIAEPKK